MDTEDTDRSFPPFPESHVTERPIPIGPSIRQEFLAHRRHIDKQFEAFSKKLDALTPPELTPSSAGRRVACGALRGTKWGAAIVGVLGLLQVALKLKRPELAGPLDDLIALFR
jgi:hypothetical protein